MDTTGKELEQIYLHFQPEFNFVTVYVMDELRFVGVLLSDFAQWRGDEEISITMALKSESNSAVLLDESLDMLDDIDSKNVAEMILSFPKHVLSL